MLMVASLVQDEQDLQQAAAAVARLTPPSTPVAFQGAGGLLEGFKRIGRGDGSAASARAATGGAMATGAAAGDESEEGPMASHDETVQDLERAVEAAGLDALTFDERREQSPGAQGTSSATGAKRGLDTLRQNKTNATNPNTSASSGEPRQHGTGRSRDTSEQ